jgi:hypothetical protein
MPRRGFRGHHWLSALSIVALTITTFSPITLTRASAAPALVTCVNLQTGTERISHTGKCRYSQEAQAKWHKNPSDSSIASGTTAKVIVVCSNKESSPVVYQVIRKKCARHQVTTIFSRSGSLPAQPDIAEAVSYGHDSASLKLVTDPEINADAPIAYYTITSTTVDTRTAVIVQSQRVYYWKDLSLVINVLQASTKYTFTVSATTADGTSLVSGTSLPVITRAYEPPAATVKPVVSTWTSRTSAADNGWYRVTYGNGIFVAVANSGTGNRVMTSPDGITWTARASAADNLWYGVAYGNGMFVAVASDGTNRVMTSPDGITWTGRTAAENNPWRDVHFGNGIFIAVTDFGTNRVMTSTDGITWTPQSVPVNSWRGVTYGNGTYVAVANGGTNRVMTSPDGITWTARTSANNNNWESVVYGNGTFVAVAQTGSNDRVMTSPDGITWTARPSAADNVWRGVVYGNGTFVAVANSGTGNRVMTSPDGITWTARASAADNNWASVTYGNGTFVAVSYSGTGDRVMTYTP